MPSAYAFYQNVRHLNVDWSVFAGMFVISLALILTAIWLSLRSKSVPSDVGAEKPLATAEVRTDPDSLLFSPFQIEAFRLAKDIRELLLSLDSALLKDGPKEHELDSEGRIKLMQESLKSQHRLRHGYALDFERRVQEARHKFGKLGITDPVLEKPWTDSSGGSDAIAIFKALRRLALLLDDYPAVGNSQ